MVVDHTLGDRKDHTTTLWTTAHDIQMQEGQFPDSYDLTHPANKSVLRTFVFGSSGTSIRQYRGSRAPFAGWQMAAEEPKPASAIMVEQPADHSWVVTIWLFDDAWGQGGKVTAMPSMHDWKGPESWAITVPMESGTIHLSREADAISLQAGRTTPLIHLMSAKPMGVDGKVAEIGAARERMRWRAFSLGAACRSCSQRVTARPASMPARSASAGAASANARSISALCAKMRLPGTGVNGTAHCSFG